jgi:hypothetical protein
MEVWIFSTHSSADFISGAPKQYKRFVVFIYRKKKQ